MAEQFIKWLIKAISFSQTPDVDKNNIFFSLKSQQITFH